MWELVTASTFGNLQFNTTHSVTVNFTGYGQPGPDPTNVSETDGQEGADPETHVNTRVVRGEDSADEVGWDCGVELEAPEVENRDENRAVELAMVENVAIWRRERGHDGQCCRACAHGGQS